MGGAYDGPGFLENGLDEEQRELLERLRRLQKSGYVRPDDGLWGNSPQPMHHVPCGQAVYAPEVHDPLCPANGKDREEPRLGPE